MTTKKNTEEHSVIGSWFHLLLHLRKQEEWQNIFTRIKLQPDASVKKKLGWLYYEFRYTCSQILKIQKEINIYGADIANHYSTSKLKQFVQQCYLAFWLGVDYKNYRKYLLFEAERWKLVKKFTYRHALMQLMFIKNSFPEEKELLENKLNFYKHCLKHNLPTPPILAAYINKKEVINKKGILSFPAVDIFIKDLEGACGEGASKFRFDGVRYFDSEGKGYSNEQMSKYFQKKSRTDGDFIVQTALRNHKDWNGFTTGGLATCRVVTARTPEGPIVTEAATLRMPTGSSATDNFDSGGIAASINLATGDLSKAVSMEPRDGFFEFDVHPDTKEQITGSKVPHWNSLKDFAIKVHHSVDTIFVGWDIALTTSGLVVVEGNITWTPGVVESPQKQPLLDTNYPLLFDRWRQNLL